MPAARPPVNYRDSVPRALKPGARKILVEAAGSGLGLADCARCAGIAPDTLNRWHSAYLKGEVHESLNRLFAAMEEAEIAFKQRLIKLVEKAAESDWRAAMTLLERRWPNEWAKRTVVHVSGEMTPDEAARELRAAVVGMDFYRRSAGRLETHDGEIEGTPHAIDPKPNGNGHANGNSHA